MRRSRILQHNIDVQTDKLYHPLRETLIQYSSQKNKNISNTHKNRSSSVYNLRGSQVSQKAIELSSQQAQHIINTIQIPTHDSLRAYGNLNKIQGKKFIAISINTKQVAAINQNQFKARQRIASQGLKRTLYEISDTINFNTINSNVNVSSNVNTNTNTPVQQSDKHLHETNITLNERNSSYQATPLVRKQSGNSQRSTSIRRMSVVSREIRDMKIFKPTSQVNNPQKIELDINSIQVTPMKDYIKRNSDISTFYSSDNLSKAMKKQDSKQQQGLKFNKDYRASSKDQQLEKYGMTAIQYRNSLPVSSTEIKSQTSLIHHANSSQ